ncbi:M56 family metallopeptidase [Citricoccus sp. NR2]|uniref:M56 family metallopeptidase n=1 Tax=Citricoccus sp. NR2 TaxID=3004095 RepID=UPI0022DDB336|nr:M56 family metallopeptidase [Citricoccus sp. NR2]WBL18149.1 M56 family metallopeptidase [Citricoccus sp. NR2]
MTPYLLLVAAIALAWPVPVALSRASWVRRAPATAMILWQAVGLAGGITMIGAPLIWGLAPFGTGLISALSELIHLGSHGGLSAIVDVEEFTSDRIVGVTLGLALGVHLILTLLDATRKTVQERSRHRRAVQLLTAAAPFRTTTDATTGQMRVLPLDHPLAYCLPGITNSLTVISRGLIEQLEPAQLDAVVAHEQAHLRQRHDLLRLAFEAWSRACAWLPTTAIARQAVTELTEMLADDAALRKHRQHDLVSAIAVVAGAGAGTSSATPTSDHTENDDPKHSSSRLERLLHPHPAPPRLFTGTVLVVSAMLMIGPILLILIG